MIQHTVETANALKAGYTLILELTDGTSVNGAVLAYGPDWVRLQEIQAEKTIRYYHQSKILSIEVEF